MRYSKDYAIVIKKNQLRGDNILVTLFSKTNGKIIVKAYGVKKINSRRKAHLETGNFIAFSMYKKGSNVTLTETELIYGYSKVRRSSEKLAYLFTYLFVLNRILPENQAEHDFFDITVKFLKSLNNKIEFTTKDLLLFFDELLYAGGFLSAEKSALKSYDTLVFVEELIGRKINFVI